MKNNTKHSSMLFIIACILIMAGGAVSLYGGVHNVLFAFGDTTYYIRLLSLLQTCAVISLLCAVAQIVAGAFGLRNWDDTGSCLRICFITLVTSAVAYSVIIPASGMEINKYLPYLLAPVPGYILYIIGALLNKKRA